MSLRDFLLARITKDEARAEYVHVLDCELNAGEWMTTGECDCGQPERVLADCEAKRRIVEQSEEASSDRSAVASEFACSAAESEGLYASDPGELIRRALALPYADHPDYREEWKA